MEKKLMTALFLQFSSLLSDRTRCPEFLCLISSQIAPSAWILSSLNSTKHFERPRQRLLLFPGRGHTMLSPSHLCSLMHTSSIPHSVFSSISERWRFSSLKVSSWTRITWGDIGKQQARKKEHNTCPQHPTGIFHPQFKHKYKASLGPLVLQGPYWEDHTNNHAQSFTLVFKDVIIQA